MKGLWKKVTGIKERFKFFKRKDYDYKIEPSVKRDKNGFVERLSMKVNAPPLTRKQKKIMKNTSIALWLELIRDENGFVDGVKRVEETNDLESQRTKENGQNNER